MTDPTFAQSESLWRLLSRLEGVELVDEPRRATHAEPAAYLAKCPVSNCGKQLLLTPKGELGINVICTSLETQGASHLGEVFEAIGVRVPSVTVWLCADSFEPVAEGRAQ